MSDPCRCASCERVFQWGADADSALVKNKSCRENAYWKLSHHVRAEHPETLMVCPRRGEAPYLMPGDDGKDFWRGAGDGCSYCGSISPEEFFAAVEAGAEIGPTDKSYKAYVDLHDPRAGKPYIVSRTNFDPRNDDYVKVTPENADTLPLDPQEKAEALEKLEDGGGVWIRVIPRPERRQGKFHFQHLSPEQRRRFIELYNSKAMKLGYPGHFYARPFFCAPADATAT